MENGKVIIFSAPSGAGKTTIVKHLLQHFPQLAFSVSATTRTRRPNETDGKDYYFLSVTDFIHKIKHHEFLEYEQVYEQLYYGTLKAEVERLHKAGKAVIFDVDVKGGVNLKKYFQQDALAVFVKVDSVETLAKRLEGRNTETPEKKAERLAKADAELQFEPLFDEVILNDDLSKAFEKAEKMVRDFLAV